MNYQNFFLIYMKIFQNFENFPQNLPKNLNKIPLINYYYFLIPMSCIQN